MHRGLQSTHGRTLLQELQRRDASLPKVLECIQKDPLAGRLAKPETGENSFHVLLASGRPTTWIQQVLQALIIASSEGLRRKDKEGDLPLHIYLMQREVDVSILRVMLNSYPESAGITSSQGLVALHYAVMREDSQAEVCKLLCQTYKDSPMALSSSQCLPLHYAAKRLRPNLDVLRILLRRHSEGARAFNSYGALPLHCMAQHCIDVRAIELLLEAYPEAASVPDRQGRLPLHLAVLSVGRDHSDAVDRDREEIEKEVGQGKTNRNTKSNNAREDDSGDESDVSTSSHGSIDVEVDRKCATRLGALQQHTSSSRDRTIIQVLIKQYPQGLVSKNHFDATPVDTVLQPPSNATSRKKASRTIVRVYNLYHDPLTARLLLLSHRHFKDLLGGWSMNYYRTLKELNWEARRDAIIVSMMGEPLANSASARRLKELRSEILSSSAGISDGIITNSSNSNNNNSKSKVTKTSSKTKSSSKSTASAISTSTAVVLDDEALQRIIRGDDSDLSKNNVLARLRRRGLLYLLQHIVAYI
jgi:hypothetical protein